MRIPPAEYLRLDLRAHDLLRDVPLHDVSVVDLPGGGDGWTVRDIRTLAARPAARPPQVVAALFAARRLLGRAFGWDRAELQADGSFAARLSPNDRRASGRAPGTADGPFHVLYEFPNEALSEIRNATVQAFLCIALARTRTGYRLYWAVYVRRMSWLTPVYLSAIEPFRRFIVYPALLRGLRAAWDATNGVPHR